MPYFRAEQFETDRCPQRHIIDDDADGGDVRRAIVLSRQSPPDRLSLPASAADALDVVDSAVAWRERKMLEESAKRRGPR